MKPTPLLLPLLLIVSGCSNENSNDAPRATTSPANLTPDTTAELTPPATKPQAQHVANFTHQFPEGKAEGNGAVGGVTPVPVTGKPFYGFDDENYSSETDYKGEGKTVNFQMKLLDHRGGIDCYEITRTVDVRKTNGVATSETQGEPKTITVEYAGEELTIFDDKHGISKFVPRTD